MSILLKADKINYSVKNRNILKEITLEVSNGEILGISGESGSGKTTLAKVIAGVFEPTSGNIEWNFTKPKSFSKQRGNFKSIQKNR